MEGEKGSIGGGFIPDIFSRGWGYRPQVDLDGIWEFRRDPEGRGEKEGWHEGKGEFTDTMIVPGAPQAQGLGEPNLYQKSFFAEPFWVRRTFKLPDVAPGRCAWLRIGGIQPAAEICLNGSHVGYTKSSRTPQRVDVSRFVNPGADNLIAIKVCNLPEVRLDGIYEMPGLIPMWTGPYGPIRCEVTDEVSVVDAYVRPNLRTGSIDVFVHISRASPEVIRLTLRTMDGECQVGMTEVNLPKGERHAEARVNLGDFTTWSPDHPKLYTLDISLAKEPQEEPFDRVGIRFGMREMSTEGTKFLLNGKPIFMRCFGDDHLYPDTLCPPADKDWYVSRLKRAREYGMNGVKSCVEVMPQEYVEAADEVGIMIIQEMPFGLSCLRENRNTIDERFRDYYLEELEGIVRVNRNHASVISYSMASEMDFDNQTQESFDFFNRDLVLKTRKLAPHALVVDCTGYLTDNFEETSKGKRHTDYYVSLVPAHKDVLEEPRARSDGLHPKILHEYLWWSCYPDPANRVKYDATQMKPFWLDTLERTARENGQWDLVPTYRKNSLWLQALSRKDGVEYVRRNPNVEGYILWLFIDLGQWSEGLLDDFWNPKNVSAREFLKSNGDTIIILAKEGNRCLKMGSKERIPLAVDHYGGEILDNCTIRWKAVRDSVFQEGELEVPELGLGELTQAGCAEIDLPVAEKPYRFKLHAALYNKEEEVNTNEWSFWVFPDVREEVRNVEAPGNAGTVIGDGIFLRLGMATSSSIPTDVSLVVADSVDPALAKFIDAGGRCLLFSHGAVIENSSGVSGPKNLYKFFRPIPWNVGDNGNSGTVISDHPALEKFPNEGMCDLQFISMLKGNIPMEFSPLLKYGVHPIIRGIDHYKVNRSNAYMLEFKVGRGMVLVTCLGVLEQLGKHIEAEYLLDCLMEYTRGPRFSPKANVPKTEFLRWFSFRQEG